MWLGSPVSSAGRHRRHPLLAQRGDQLPLLVEDAAAGFGCSERTWALASSTETALRCSRSIRSKWARMNGTGPFSAYSREINPSWLRSAIFMFLIAIEPSLPSPPMRCATAADRLATAEQETRIRRAWRSARVAAASIAPLGDAKTGRR